MSSWDVVVIGAGHNGLTIGALLAKAGRKVLILERRDRVGGLAAGEEFAPGYRTQGLLLDTSGVRRSVISDLGLVRHGLECLPESPPVFIPQEGGLGLVLYHDPLKAEEELKKVSAKDASAYARFDSFFQRIRPFVRRILDERPPAVLPQGPAEHWKLLRTGLSLRLLGQKDMLELLRIGPMCVADWLDEWFSNDLLKAALAGPALLGVHMGPRSAGTTAAWLLKECAADRCVRGGPAALIRALAAAAKSYGTQIRLSSAARAILVRSGQAVGVTLEDGTEVFAPVIISTCDPKHTFLDLIRPMDLPRELEQQVRVIKMRGISAKVSLALTGPLSFASRPGRLFEAARTGERLDALERAFDAVKYRKFSDRPSLEIRIPTVSDPDLAPSGHHVVEILAHFAPYDLAGGWTEERREALGDAVISVLKRYAPSIESLIAARQVLTPADLELRYGLTGGHLYHGEHSLDQLYALRPSADLSRYATPIPGLFLAGSGCHPGGGITCAPATLAAAAILSR